jgi:hypothetical protein
VSSSHQVSSGPQQQWPAIKLYSNYRPGSSSRLPKGQLHATASQRHGFNKLPDMSVIMLLSVTVMFAGSAFYRAESAQGRDLAVLAAAVYRKEHGRLRVLDVMAGSGMRGARYIQQVRTDSNPAPAAAGRTDGCVHCWQLRSLVA